MEKKFRIIHSIICAAIAAVIFVVVITISANIYLPIKDWLKNVFTQHWIGKSILSAAVFIVIGIISFLLPIRADEEKIGRLLKILSWLLVVGLLAIFAFFIYETLK